MKVTLCLHESAAVLTYDLPLESEESYTLLCPWCGNCWGRVLGNDTSWWRNRFIPCINHPEAAKAYGCNIGGSLLELSELNLLDVLPPALLKREFYLYIKELYE